MEVHDLVYPNIAWSGPSLENQVKGKYSDWRGLKSIKVIIAPASIPPENRTKSDSNSEQPLNMIDIN